MNNQECEERIFDTEHSLVVVAGAGTGKTYKLVRRYIKLIATRIDGSNKYRATPDQVLAVTFTRAAAAEMRSRVIGELAKAKAAKDENCFRSGDEIDHVMLDVWRSKPDYNKLIEQIDGAPIDTLHGLCARLLREYPEMSGVPVNAQPLEPGQESLYLDRFVSGYVDSLIDDSDNPLNKDLQDLLSAFPLNIVKTEIASIVGQPDDILQTWETTEGANDLRDQFMNRQVGYVMRQMTNEVDAAIVACKAALTRKQTPKFTGNLGDKLQQIATFKDLISKAGYKDQASNVDFRTSLNAVSKGAGKTALGDNNTDVVEAISLIESQFHKAASIRGRNVITSLPFSEESQEWNQRASAMLPLWIRVGRDARGKYQESLFEKGLLRFNDLEDRAVALLKSDKVSEILKGRFTHILVDEFQDTNGKQIEIIEGIASAAGDVKKFYVGDPKQAIYRFRGADVHVFEGVVNKAGGGLVTLNETRRTAPTLARFFNQFFPKLLAPAENGLGDDKASVPWTGPIECSRNEDAIGKPSKPIDLLLRKAPDKTATEAEDEELNATTLVTGEETATPDSDGSDDSSDEAVELEEKNSVVEARRLAGHIRSMIDTVKIKKKGKEESLIPSDFVVLLPKWKLAEIFRAALEEQGVAAELAGGRGLLALPEVRDLLNLIRFFADWNDELAAAGVLRGPCFGLSDLGLYVLARWPGVQKWTKVEKVPQWTKWNVLVDEVGPFKYPRSLHQAALKAGILPEEAVQALLNAKVLDSDKKDSTLNQLRQDAAALCRLDESGRPALDSGIIQLQRLAGMAGVAPVADLLVDAIVTFRLEAIWINSPTGARAVANAWRFVELIRQFDSDGAGLADIVQWINAENDPTPEGLISAESDAVVITTLHGSKGLEWPVVAVAGLGSGTGGGFGASWKFDKVPNLDATEPASEIARIKVAIDGWRHVKDPLNQPCNILCKPDEVAEIKRLLYVAMTRAKDHLILSGIIKKNANKTDEDGTPQMEKCGSHQTFLATLLNLVPDDEDVFEPANGWSDYINVVRNIPEFKKVEWPSSDNSQLTGDPDVVAWGTDRQAVAVVTPSKVDGVVIQNVTFDRITKLPSPVQVPEKTDNRKMGTMFHELMEYWNFQWDLNCPDDPLNDLFLLKHAEAFFPMEGDRHASWLRQCLNLVAAHPIYAELRRAAGRGDLYHEVPIEALLTGQAILSGNIHVAGRIDLLFKDDNGLWCVLDYKETTKVTDAKELDGLARTYGPQLALYREVLKAWKPNEVGRIGLWLALIGQPWWAKVG